MKEVIAADMNKVFCADTHGMTPAQTLRADA
jgi:hypothetical protein